MSKYIFLLMGLMALADSAKCQSFLDDLTISVEFAAAHHDKRVFFGRQHLLLEQPEQWGTWQYGISVDKKIVDWGAFSVRGGLGYSLEHMTFIRLVDHCLLLKPGESCDDVLIYSRNGYKVSLLQIPVNLSVGFIENWRLGVDLRSFVDICKSLPNIAKKRTLDFYSMEVNPGMSYEWEGFRLGLNYRIWQIKKIDRVLFSRNTISPRYRPNSLLEKEYDHYNPVKWWFSVGYRFPKADLFLPMRD